ncbi:MAG: SIR2 family protein [candidate division Zixibacteria bacterium]|nr:SIR2 family protein [candidate division Zixibacteria bacterium]
MVKVSFLIGSGFSVPAGYPTTKNINKKLQRINASEICVSSNRQAWFLNDQPDPNSWINAEQRQFVQEFLEFYDTQVLKQGESFHYETFYDYYISAYKTGSHSEALHNFLKSFKNKYNKNFDNLDLQNLLGTFHDIFSQLLAGQLNKPLRRVHRCEPYGSECNAFLVLVGKLAQSSNVHFHSLNHDLYLENLALSDTMQGDLDDGFEELGSQLYVKKYDEYATYMIRLRRFTNKYESRFCLYKLHGSIDHYWCNFEDGFDLVKLPWTSGFLAHEIYKEFNRNGKYAYDNRSTDVVPDFLSGTTHKPNQYDRGPYYPLVHEHFKKNLTESKSLIVIGYGFGDLRINNYIEENFLTDSDKVMFVVDIERPENAYLDRPNVHFIEGGVSGMNTKTILERISSNIGNLKDSCGTVK